jgi:hypothetical protein
MCHSCACTPRRSRHPGTSARSIGDSSTKELAKAAASPKVDTRLVGRLEQVLRANVKCSGQYAEDAFKCFAKGFATYPVEGVKFSDLKGDAITAEGKRFLDACMVFYPVHHSDNITQVRRRLNENFMREAKGFDEAQRVLVEWKKGKASTEAQDEEKEEAAEADVHADEEDAGEEAGVPDKDRGGPSASQDHHVDNSHLWITSSTEELDTEDPAAYYGL